MNPYRDYVARLARTVRDGRALPLGGIPRPAAASPSAEAPRVMIFSPHPDDECIVGLLALRLLREAGMRVLNVAVTQGSDAGRRAARWDELRMACEFLGFDLVATRPGGLRDVRTTRRDGDPRAWRSDVDVVAALLDEHRPTAVFCPHEADWNSTHVGTHHLVLDALSLQPDSFATTVVETEFWGAMASPNLMVEASEADLADLVAATSFHAGEVRRNPYHLLLPAWMMDNVRRGGELVGGQGGAAPDFTFATLYRAREWSGGRLLPAATGRVLTVDAPAGDVLSSG